MCSRCYFVIKSIGTNMFREFVILLCAGSFVTGIAVHTGARNTPANSQASSSGADQDRLALPSQDSYKNVAAPSSKYIPNSAVSYQVNSAVVDTISEVTPANQVQYGSSKVQQPTVTISATVAADPSSPEYNNILERYAPAVEPIKPYFAAPVVAKTVSIGSQEAANAGSSQDTEGDFGYITRPFVVYTNNAAPSRQYFAVPSAQTVESQRTVQVHPPSSQGAQYGAAAAGQQTISPPRPFYPASSAILESHGEFKAQSPVAPSYQVNQVQVTSPPPPQYLPAPKITYKLNPSVKTVAVPVPVSPKKVTIEAYNSVLAHPPPAPKYAPAPIPVPVIFKQLETNHPADQQFVLTKTLVPTGAPYAPSPVEVQPIPVPVYTTSGARLQYHHIPVNGGHQQGYAKAVVFSPASEVSRVIFNGLGVTYGW